MKKYLYLWWKITSRTTQVAFYSRSGVVLFTIGKLLRFIFFLIFLLLLTSRTNTLAGFTTWQVMLFFITFSIIDIISQFLWREVYRFRQYIITGNFDYLLVRPMSPLFRSLFGGSDIFDLLILLPLIGFLIFVIYQIGGVTFINLILYFLLVINGLLIALSFHIFVLALGIVTTEVDNAIWMFREIMQLGRVPIQIYPKTITFAFTYLLPVAAMIAIPTQALLGLLSFQGVLIAFSFSGLLIWGSYSFWKYALRQYSSASS